MADDGGFTFTSMDLETPAAAAAPPRAPRFRPKLARNVPKSVPTPPAATKPDPGPDPPAVAKPDPGPDPPAVAKPDPDPSALPAPPPVPLQEEEEKEKEQLAAEDSSMVVDDAACDFEDDFDDDDEGEVEDVVVRELDVYFAPSIADGASLYVMQYPLRPPWRPYDLSESCEGVRLKPKHSKVEVDFSMDISNGNYDDEMAESSRSQKQMLSSAVTPSTSGFAIGTIMRNELHLNPVHAVVQLRPSLKHTRAGVARRKQSSRSIESNKKPNEQSLGESLKPSTEQQGKPAPDNSSEGFDDVEPWVTLKYHPIESSLSRSYQKQMMREKNNHVKFVVKNSDYATSLCPGTSTDNKRSIGIVIRDLISLPLEERLIKWLSEGRQVNRFAALLHLDPTISIEDDLLRILPLYAYLVQGLWVSKSSLICKGFEALVRDYIIFLFSKNKTIRYDKRKSPIPPVVRHYLSQLAFQRPLFSDLKFREATDLSFIKAYPHAVKEQECAWSSREQELLESFRGSFRNMMEKQAVDFLMNALNPKLVKKVTSSVIADPGHKKDMNTMTSSTGMTVPSNSSQEGLVKVLLEVFHLHSVRSLGSIKQALQGRGIDPPTELISVLGQITENVHGVYISKSAGNPDLHALRTVIIKLFMENKPNAKLRNNQIVAAVRSSLNRNFSADEYKQVVNGLCINKDGWMLKDGEC